MLVWKQPTQSPTIIICIIIFNHIDIEHENINILDGMAADLILSVNVLSRKLLI